VIIVPAWDRFGGEEGEDGVCASAE